MEFANEVGLRSAVGMFRGAFLIENREWVEY